MSDFQARYDLALRRGVPFAEVFRLLDYDDEPLALDDHEIYAAIHATDAFDGTVLATMSVDVLDAETGDVAFRLPQDVTASFAVSRYAGWFYSWYSGPSTGGERRPLWRGQVTVQ